MTRLSPHLLHRSKRVRNSRTHWRRLLLEQLETRSLLATFSVVNGDNAGTGSLRQAILDANASAGADLIQFTVAATDASHVYYKNDGIAGKVTLANISTTIASDDSTITDIDPDWTHSWYRIKPTTALPNVTDLVTIDGYTQPGSLVNTLANGDDAVLKIELDGSLTGGSGLVLVANSNTVRGLAINSFVGAGIFLNESDSNVIAGNFIGTDATGTIARPNDIGIKILAAQDNLVGGTLPADRNVLSGNKFDGINVQGTYNPTLWRSTGNQILGNFAGTDASGTVALPNGSGGFDGYGINIGGGSGNLVANNLVSGNGDGGIALGDYSTVVQGNFIGTDVTGTLPLANTGNLYYPQFGNGIIVSGAGNVIGGTALNEANLIANNVGAGVLVTGTANNIGNVIRGNSIVANGSIGIDLAPTLVGARGVTGNDVGDGDTGPNGYQNFPVLTSVVSSASNTVVKGSLNSTPSTTFTLDFYDNLAADPSGYGEGQTFIGSATVTTDASGSVTFLVNFPTIIPLNHFVTSTATNPTNGTSEFSGTRLTTACVESSSLVVTTSADVVANDCVTSLREAITFANLNAGLDVITFNISGLGVHTIQPLSALPTITSPVTINGYSQPGSIQNTDTPTGGNNAVLQIELDGSLAGSSSGLVITVGNSTVRGLVINRFRHDGIQLVQGDNNVIEGNYIGTDSTGTVELGNGSGGFGEGSSGFPGAGGGGADYFGVLVGSRSFTSNITYGSSSNRIGTNGDGTSDAAERNLISGNDGANIVIVGVGSDSNVVAGNLIGTNAAGTMSLSLSNGTVGEGIGVIVGSGAQFNRIGTDGNDVADALERNVISGHTGSATTADQHTRSRGVVLFGLGTQNNVVAGNYIGTDVAGTVSVANGDGVKSFAFAGKNLIGTNADGTADAAERNIISGNLQNGIVLEHSNPNGGTVVAGNFIGTDGSGTSSLPNSSGVRVVSSTGNLIGGTTPATRNVISGNTFYGVSVQLVAEAGNRVQGNFIGVDATGTAALGNLIGVSYSTNLAGGNVLIGGSTPGAGNVISGNGRTGVELYSFNATVQGNFIGTDVSGTVDLGNRGVTQNFDGGVVVNGSNHLIGGAGPGAGNVISGNDLHGVFISGSDNVVQGNFIGTDVTGTVGLGNTDVGVNIIGGSRNTIGGSAAGAGNLISANGRNAAGTAFGANGDGVLIYNVNTADNVIEGNSIGVSSSGAPLGNFGNGVASKIAPRTHVIGNVIANNTLSGVVVTYNAGVNGIGNEVSRNSISANGRLGIDLADDGVTANDLGDGDTGANALQNFPLIASAVGSATTTIVQGSLNSVASRSYTIEFFASPAADPTGFGEGQTYLGSTTVTTDAAGNATFSVMLSVATAAGYVVTATATDPNGSTSEFSGKTTVAAFVPATISGTKFNDLNGNGVRDSITNSSGSITVPGTSDPWLAGMPNGSTASGGDVAPNQSPVLVPMSLTVGTPLTFDVNGCVSFAPSGCAGNNPDGSSGGGHTAGAENGISNVVAPWNSLIGVFLGPNQPNLVAAPAALNFSTAASRDFLTLSPALQQTFFIGNGRTSSNQVQEFVVPAGATRLFLGTMDGFGWFNNSGVFTVTVNSSSVEPPLANWSIELDAGADGSVDASDLTDANGQYSFVGLLPETYRVREVQQPGWTQTSIDPADIVVSASGQSFTSVNFGNSETVSACIISSNQIARWPADGNADDAVGDDHGTLINGALANAPGIIGQAFSLDGLNDEVEFSSFNGQSLTDFSIKTWVYIDPAVNQGEVRVFSWDDYPSGGSDGVREAIVIKSSSPSYGGANAGENRPMFGILKGETFDRMSSAASLTTGWHQLAGVRSGTTLKLYVDGALHGTMTSTITGALSPESSLTLGRVHEGALESFQGRIDEVSLYNRALSDAEILLHYNAESAGNCTVATATIHGQKFQDYDGDGTQDSEDLGLPGWTIYLDNGNGMLDAGERSTITDALGHYAFADVQSGTYQVRELPQSGWIQTTPIASFNTSAGGNFTADLGNFETITVSGQKFEDHNANGVKDAGDQGLGNWTATLFRWTNDHFEGIRSTMTAPDGTYSFDGVGPGLWAVDEVPQSGWTRTNAYPQFNPRSGENLSDKDLANFRGITLTGKKFEDHDGDGVQDPEDQGLPGWTIFIDRTRNGHADEGEPTFITGGDGSYTIPADFLPPGNYSIRESGVPGWRQTFPQSGGYDIAVGGLNGARSGITITDRNFGNIHLGTITGQKFYDVDGNGIRQLGEPGLRFWPIFLDENGNGSHELGESMTWTNADGNYSFTVEPGTYVVREVQQDGWIQTTTDPAPITVNAPGQIFADRDFGNDRDNNVTLISGRKFFDVDGDRVADPGEPGLRYWPIFIDSNMSGAYEAGEPITSTDWNGVYSFSGVAPGTYRVREIQQPGWTQTTVNPADVVVTANGQTIQGIDFGNQGSNGPGPGVNPPTDLEVIKGALRAVAGEQITYTLRVTNRGPNDSYGVILGDQLKPGLVYESATPSQGICFGGQTIICAVGPLAVGESATVTIVAHVQSWVVDEIENEVCVYSTATDTESANNCAIARTPIDTRTDLELVKTADGLRAIAGRDLTYTMSVKNKGPSDSTNVVLEDDLPPEVSFVSASVSPHGSCQLEVTTVVCDLGTVANGETATVTLVVHVGPWVPEDAIITNTGTVRDDYGSGGVSVIRIPCGRSTDFELNKTGPFTNTNAEVYYVIEVTNHGPSNSAGPIVGDDLPDEINFLYAVPSQGVCNQQDPLLCNLGPMIVGQTETVTVFVGVPHTVLIENVRNEAVVQPPEGDGNLENNWGGTGGGIRPEYSLGISKEAPPEIPPGKYLNYTLHVTNEGPDDASNVIVGDTIPAGLIFISATPTQGSCNALFNPILCFLGPMRSGDEADVEIVVFVPPSIPVGTEFVNRGYGWGGVPPVFGDARTRVALPPGVSLVKEAPLDVIAGTEMTYTLRTRNRGPAESTNITLEDVLPPEVNFVSANPSQGSCDTTVDMGETTVSCALGDIAADGVATVDIVVFVPSFVLPGTIIGNEGCVTALYGSDLTVYCDIAHTSVGDASDVGLIKVSTPGPVTAGENIEYTLEAFNLGPSDARQFVFGDTLPAPLVFVSATSTKGTCDYNSGVVLCNIGYLAAGQHEFVTITAFVPPSTPDGTVIENTACIIECGHDILHDNDCSTVRNVVRANSVLTGIKFNDVNGDGVRDAGEPGIEGWQIFLDLDGDNVLDANERSTTTDASGVYTFTGLGKATWFVREVQNPEWIQTTPNPAGVTVTGLQQTYFGGDFGNFNQIAISGRVFHDRDNNGIQDTGEPGLGGWIVIIDANDNGALDTGERSTISGPGGEYRFGDLGPGTHLIRELPQPGWTVTTPNPAPIVASSGGDVANIDFGNRRSGSPAKITGGGSIDQSVRNFGFVVMPKVQGGVTTYFGSLEFQDKSLGYNMKATAITFINVEADRIHGQFTGTATLNGVDGYRFYVELEDRAEPGALVDKFRIRITGPGGFTYDSNTYATKGGLLDKGGNIQIHKASSLTANTSPASAATAKDVDTHSLKTIGLGHASDSQSAMYAPLAASQSRRDLTTHDMALLGNFESEGAETRRSVTAVVSERSYQRNDSARGLFDDLQYAQSLDSNRRSLTVNSSPDQYVRWSMKSNDGSKSSSPVDLSEWSLEQILDSLVSDPKRVS